MAPEQAADLPRPLPEEETVGDGLGELARHLQECLDKVERGELPADQVPRYFFAGHDVVHLIAGKPRDARWRCVACTFEWVGEDGTKCPKCGSVK